MKLNFRFVSYIFILVSIVLAVQYDNWRKPFFFAAATGGYVRTSSPSLMFWDDLSSAPVFDSLIWFSDSQLNRNHLIVEPAFQFGYLEPAVAGYENSFLHGELLNEIRFYNLSIRQTADIDSRFEFDTYYPGHRQRGAHGRIEEAYCQLDWKYGFFRLGRLNRNWGPFPDRSLVLSTNPYTFDALEWQVHSSVFEFRHLVAAFPHQKTNWDTDNGTVWNRFFAAHSLSLMFGEWVTAGLTETVLFTRDKSFPDLQYVNPFSIYTVTNTNQEGDGNLMLAFNWDVHPFTKKVSLKGQLAFDDFQVDNEIETDKEPAHWGIDCGAYWYDPFAFKLKHTIYSEFTTLSEWMYTVPDNNSNNGERYIYLRKSLGYPENDLTRFTLGAQVIGCNYWLADARVSYSEKGNNNPNSQWNDHTHFPGLPFDTLPDIKEKTFSFSLNARGYFRDYVDGWISAGGSWKKNKNNIKTEKYNFDPIIQAGISVHFSDLYVKLPEK
ncbi:MAG: hypothetical protein JW915_06545 [Chitinispirillaceae bacterium]|nr:hypothetical protein [Chitinispirillaceae bacterium]